MGNLAVKLEREWHSRCGETGRDVKLIRTDGTEVEEFNRPMLALEIMVEFPACVVVQRFPYHHRNLAKLGQLRVLQPHDLLYPGKTYFLFPIPLELMTEKCPGSFQFQTRSRHLESSKNHLSLLMERSNLKAAGGGGGGGGDPEFPGFQTQSSSKLSEIEEDSAPPEEIKRWWNQVPSSSEEHSIVIPEKILTGWPVASDHGGATCTIAAGWRPGLVSIPESPIGFHSGQSTPMSPMSPRSPMSPMSPNTPLAFHVISMASDYREQEQHIMRG